MGDLNLKIKTILQAAVNAPSGDNSQPWKFILTDNRLSVILVKGIDKTLYNYREFGSLLAHGALIENINVLSAKYSLASKIELGYNETDDTTAVISFFPDNSSKLDSLADAVPERHTNRKPYRSEPLGKSDKEKLTNASDIYDDIKLHLVENLNSNKTLIKELSLNDELIFSNQYIHDMLFEGMNWTEEEDNNKIRGLYVKTMELNPDQVMAFKKLENWSLMKKLKLLGIPKLIAATNQKLYLASSALGLVTMPSETNENFLKAGRVVERVWLSATKLGLNIQPLSGIPYLALRIRFGDKSHLETSEVERILKADKVIREIFGVSNRGIALIFRIGRGQAATARSKKLLPEIKVI